MMLNTDWSSAGNKKQVTVTTPVAEFETEVVERVPYIITVTDDFAIENDPRYHIEIRDSSRIILHGTGKGELLVHTKAGKKHISFDLGNSTVAEIQLR